MDAFKGFLKKKFPFFFTGHERSIKVKKNIIALFFIKGYAVLINLLLIPLTLEILNDYRYGVWITIFNVLTWIELFDIGIGNGLRNKFTEAITNKNIKESKEYVSTAYIVLGLISFVLIVLFYIPWNYINWAKVFNTNSSLQTEIKYLIGLLFSLTSIQFSFKLINTILTADHKPAYAAFILGISNTIICIVFYVFKEELFQSLIGVGLVFTVTPLIVFILFSLWMFNNNYKAIRPTFSHFKKDKVNGLFSLGGRFFIIQIAGVVIFQTDALIISHSLSPEEVTPYNIVFRYFGVILLVANLAMTPLWSAYTEAYTKKDFEWIKSIIKKQMKLFLLVIPVLVIMIFLGKRIIRFWINDEIIIQTELLIAFALYTIFSILTGISSMVIGGINKVRFVMYITMFTMIINIPLSLFLVKYVGDNSYGVILATSICLAITAVSGAIQVKYFIFSKKKNLFLEKLLQ